MWSSTGRISSRSPPMALEGTTQSWPEQRVIGQPLLFFQAQEQSHALDAENKTGEAQRPRLSGNRGAPQSGQACRLRPGAFTVSSWSGAQKGPSRSCTALMHKCVSRCLQAENVVGKCCQHVVRFCGEKLGGSAWIIFARLRLVFSRWREQKKHSLLLLTTRNENSLGINQSNDSWGSWKEKASHVYISVAVQTV